MPYQGSTIRARPNFTATPPVKPAPPKRSALDLVRAFALLLLLPAVVLAAVFAYARYATTRTTTAPPGEPGALVWNDGGVIFANTNEIAAWVRLHGSNFQAFKRNHPAALKLVKSHPSVPVTPTKLAAGKASPVVGVSSARDWNGLGALGAAAILLLLISLAPVRALERLRLVRGGSATDLRMITVSGAAAIFAGLALALLL